MKGTSLHLSLRPLDVGFDLRLSGHEIIIVDDYLVAAYLDHDGEPRTVRGVAGQVAHVLRDAGYTVGFPPTPAPRFVDDPPCPEHGQECK